MRLDEAMSALEARGESVWDSDRPFPIFDEGYRAKLQEKITDHYRYWEIGQETIDQFRFTLNRKMREIMPLYNQLYKSEIDIDPLMTINMITELDQDITGTNSGTTTTTNSGSNTATSRTVTSETPQTMLAGNEDYASGAADANSSSEMAGETSGESSGTTGTKGTIRTSQTGYSGHAASLLMQARQSFLNIDLMVISELESLFMGLWDNGDTFTDGSRGIIGVYPYRWSYGI